MTNRTDPHRPSAILPSDYVCVLSYSRATSEGGIPIPGIGVDCVRDRATIGTDKRIVMGEHDPSMTCCVEAYRLSGRKFADRGATGKCTVCGACFVYGDLWEHTPTGELIHLGHDCAGKYEMLADREEWEMKDRRVRRAAMIMASRNSNEGKFRRFCEGHAGLLEAFEVKHEIISDIKDRLRQWGSISAAQVALVMRLADETRNPAQKAEEVNVSAPTGKATFTGRVVSTKVVEGYYGSTIKMTVKVQAPGGTWLAWGTAPAALLSASVNHGGLKGCEVEISATVEPSHDKPHFAFMKRPRGQMIKLACGTDCSVCASEKQRVA